MLIPVITTLLVGLVQVGKITYIYYTLRKTLYGFASYVSTQQGVNFCNGSDLTVETAKNFALTGAATGSASPLIADLTAEMIQIRLERWDPVTQNLSDCDCSAIGCDTSLGGRAPDFIVVTIPDGYPVRPRIPFLTLDPIPLRPEVKVPFGGT